MLVQLFKDDSGATAIEYGLILAMIAIVLLSAMQALGISFAGTLNKASAAMASTTT